jgi:hypothetical protein
MYCVKSHSQNVAQPRARQRFGRFWRAPPYTDCLPGLETHSLSAVGGVSATRSIGPATPHKAPVSLVAALRSRPLPTSSEGLTTSQMKDSTMPRKGNAPEEENHVAFLPCGMLSLSIRQRGYDQSLASFLHGSNAPLPRLLSFLP